MNQQVEYLVKEIYSDDEEMFIGELNHYASQGWRVVGIYDPSLFSQYSQPTLVLERPFTPTENTEDHS